MVFHYRSVHVQERCACSEAVHVIREFVYDRATAALRAAYGSLDEPPVLPRERFGSGELFELRWQELAEEARRIFAVPTKVPTFGEIMPEQEALASADGKAWRLFVAQAYGYKVPLASVLAPVLCRLVAQCPEVLSATYSWIPAGKVIPPHRGPNRGILRYTLGLQVPEAQGEGERVSLMIDGKEHRLREGQSILWDDTYLHSSLNTTQQPRTVLLLDIRRRPLPFFLGLLNSFVMGITYVGAFLTLRKHAERIVNRARRIP